MGLEDWGNGKMVFLFPMNVLTNNGANGTIPSFHYSIIPVNGVVKRIAGNPLLSTICRISETKNIREVTTCL
jgi:hypothetical protein